MKALDDHKTTGRALVHRILDPGRQSPALVLAPMATVSHAGFRTLVSEFGGCDLYFTEMVSAEALVGRTQFEDYYRCLDPDPASTIFQIVGYSHDAILAAAAELGSLPCAGIDVNMGCSAPHIVRKGGGIAWMADPGRSARLIRHLRSLLPDKSISVKLRLGQTDDPQALVELARGLEAEGLDFVSLHPKLRKDGSARVARWSNVDLLSDALTIPVIGNGGIVDWSSYLSRRGESDRPRARGIMIGRGAVRAPWLFGFLRGREQGILEMEIDLARVLNRFLELLELYQPYQFLPSRARRFYPYLFSNIRFGHRAGAQLAGEHDYREGKKRALRFFEEHPEHRYHVETG